MATNGTETCPECDSSPQHVAIICGPQGCRETIRACDFCGGLGIVEVKAADRWRRGQALRQLRVHKRHLTQKALAHILGISPMLLNDIEHGRAEWPPWANQKLLAEYGYGSK